MRTEAEASSAAAARGSGARADGMEIWCRLGGLCCSGSTLAGQSEVGRPVPTTLLPDGRTDGAGAGYGLFLECRRWSE